MQTINKITTHLQQIFLHLISLQFFTPPPRPPFPIATGITEAGLQYKAKYIKTKTIYVLGKNKFILPGLPAWYRLLRGGSNNLLTGWKYIF